jgi:hypothetical protein
MAIAGPSEGRHPDFAVAGGWLAAVVATNFFRSQPFTDTSHSTGRLLAAHSLSGSQLAFLVVRLTVEVLTLAASLSQPRNGAVASYVATSFPSWPSKVLVARLAAEDRGKLLLQPAFRAD